MKLVESWTHKTYWLKAKTNRSKTGVFNCYWVTKRNDQRRFREFICFVIFLLISTNSLFLVFVLKLILGFFLVFQLNFFGDVKLCIFFFQLKERWPEELVRSAQIGLIMPIPLVVSWWSATKLTNVSSVAKVTAFLRKRRWENGGFED